MADVKSFHLLRNLHKIPEYFVEFNKLVSICRMCAVCNRAFSDPTFVRYPNGVVTHVHCAKNRHVCPVTGKLFSTKQS